MVPTPIMRKTPHIGIPARVKRGKNVLGDRGKSSRSRAIGQKAKLRVRNKPGVLKVIKENIIDVTFE